MIMSIFSFQLLLKIGPKNNHSFVLKKQSRSWTQILLYRTHSHTSRSVQGTENYGLTSSQEEDFKKNGFLHIPNFWSEKTCEELKSRIGVYLKEYNKETESVSIFTTNNQVRKSDEYFLSSGNKIRFFFEEDAFDEEQRLKQSIELSINKIGHALHIQDPIFRKHSFSKRVAGILKSLDYKDPQIPQSMYIFKQPKIGGKVRPHQDGSYLYTEPQSVIGFWWALEDCSLDNGCLWAVPGSHSLPIEQRFIRSSCGKSTKLSPEQDPTFNIEKAVPLETKKGSLVLLHGSLIHFSAANTSKISRHAYAMHIVESYKTKYPKDNWLQYPKDEDFPHVYKIAFK